MKFRVILILFILCKTTFAQKKLFTMQDAITGSRSYLQPQSLSQLQFIKGTNEYVYLKKNGDNNDWVKGDMKNKEYIFLTLPELNNKLRLAGIDTVKAMPPIQFAKDNITFSINGTQYLLNLVTNSYTILLKKEDASQNAVERSNAGYISFVKDNNLYVEKDNNVIQITKDGSANLVYGSSVHRDEFGINKGTFWSPSGKLLAFYRMDQSMVTDYPIIDWTTTPATNHNIKYPMAGDKSHEVTVGIYNTTTGSTLYVNTGSPADQYLTNIAWSPDDAYLFIAVLNRAQNHMWLNQYNATTGAFIKTLFEEENEKYVEPLVPMKFLPSAKDLFLWQSRRDGWNHLYLYSMEKGLIKQITKGNFEVLDIKLIDEKNNLVYYTSTEQSPVTKNLYSVNFKTGVTKRLTLADGVHTTTLSDDGQYVLDVYSNITTPRVAQLIETKTCKTLNLVTAPSPLASYEVGNISLFTIKNSTATDIYCRMYKPANFDSTKKYPIIIYWYGGPHAQMITDSWNGGASDLWFQYMTQRGYVVFSFDPRGSSNRGREFEQTIHRRTGVPQMEDMNSALQYLNALSYIDTHRMGLFGWSYGGFMTTDYLLHYPGTFKVGVAGGPVMNWRLYEIMYGERYMDTPQENPQGYAETNLISQAGKLKDKLLLIHGLQDPVVVQQHSVNFVKACVDAGVQVDYMIYPGHEHNVIGKDRVHLMQKITDYFSQNL